MEPGPGRLIAAQAEHPLQTQRADAVLLAGDEPHGEKPHPQRLARVLQHSSSRQRYLPIAGSTAQQASRHFPRLAHCRAVGADKAIRPAKPPDIFPARRLAAKPRVELLKRPRIINPSDGMPWRAFHPSTLSGVPTCVKGIPTQSQTSVRQAASAALSTTLLRGRQRNSTPRPYLFFICLVRNSWVRLQARSAAALL